ncbi:unnamed protein product [Anisakis simplex]|uniref:Protein max (inferred by orthology to a human protein) n=1 Tax=Anisakis simplex TaxID=6269 RepID=A0A0M3K6P9_ANISI|nr:unnamed protein product [Anisakis simplex]
MSDADFSEGDEDVAMGSQAVVDTRKHARAQHNALERRRRDNIKDMYSALKDTIPGMSAERASRAVVLKNAVDMITQMENHLKKIVSENEQLEKENAELEAEIAKYEKVVCQSSTTVSVHFYQIVLSTQTMFQFSVSN